MNFISRFILSFSLLVSFSAGAADKSSQAVSIEAPANQAAVLLRKQLDAMTSLQGDFVQTLLDQNGKKLDESKGTFIMQRPGKFYWDTTSPAPQLLISNQKTIWLYDPDLQTVTVRPFSDDLQKTPTLLLTADVESLRKHFSIKRSEQPNKVEKFTLTPKVSESLFQQLTLIFIDGLLTEFNIQDSLSQITQIVLSKQKRNQPVDEKLFNFVPPEGVDIIKDQ
ncbi:MAG: outer membrane lipoprotein chaperone LolA [Pseudomonadota bacterium]